MGQQVIGVIMGVKIPDELRGKIENDEHGLLDLWRRKSKRRITDELVKWDYDTGILGIWIAYPSGDEGGCVDLWGGPIEVADLYKSPAYRRAIRVWRRFSMWAAVNVRELDWPRLFLAEKNIA